MEVLKYMYPLAPIKMEMTLRELINSVDAEQYSDSPLFLQLTQAKPEYGASRQMPFAQSSVSWICDHRTTERKIISI